MIDPELQEQILKQLADLPPVKQYRVLDFARILAGSQPRGTPGSQLLWFSGVMTHTEAKEFLQSIDEDCEQIDEEGW